MTTHTVVIVGGGTAGWLSAGIIASKHCVGQTSDQQTKVILVESPDVKNLGVGEGTWPTMRDTLRQIGISEKQFLRCCDASFKQASKFVDWQHKHSHYYHPFTAPAGYGAINMANYQQQANTADNFEQWVCSQGSICDEYLAPKLSNMPDYAFSLNYGYHLNAGKFVEMLHKHCVEQLGVQYVQGHVQQVNSAENKDIASIRLASGQEIAGDLFIDCSGFSAILIGQHFNIPFKSQQQVLFNDAALALQVEHKDEQSPIASCTVASAKQNGWIWDIALQNRRGIGHVFSSQFTDAEQVEEVLMQYVKNDPHLKQASLSPRLISFSPGHRETFWHQNCVAIGVSAGFVEPLEATALVLIEKSAEWISHQLVNDRKAMAVLAKRFNQLTTARWQEIIDFLKLHYVLSERDDSEYWRAHRDPASIPESLNEALDLWQTQAPWLYESNQRFELFSSASKQYVLYGMGFKTYSYGAMQQQKDRALLHRLQQETLHTTETLLNALPTNRAYFNGLART